MLPQLFLERMEQMLGEEYPLFLNSFEQEKYQALRLNPLKWGEDTPEQPEGKLSFLLTPVPWAENGFYYEKEAQPGKHPYHEAGVYYIQEPSAMAPAGLLQVQPGERILDLCAAPGGKSTQLAGQLQGKGLLVCNEIHPARAKILSENIERMGVRNALVTNESPAALAEIFPEYFDKILVDAPCSGEGMFRKNEEACREWSPENVELCAARQDEILDCAARMLRPGGKLVYSTCTFAPVENEGSVSRFLGRNPEFSLLPVDKAVYVGVGAAAEEKIARERKLTEAEADKAAAEKIAERQNLTEAEELLEKGLTQSRDRACSGRPEWTENPAPQLEYTLRLWPHRVKGEGHYAAVLQKAGEKQPVSTMTPGGLEKGLSEKELTEWKAFQKEFLHTDLQGKFLKFGDNLYLAPEELPALRGMRVLRPGLHLGTLKKNRFEPSHALALALRRSEAVHVCNLEAEDERTGAYLRGQTFPAEGDKGWYLICVDGYSIGWGKLAGGIMKNHYPKGLRKN